MLRGKNFTIRTSSKKTYTFLRHTAYKKGVGHLFYMLCVSACGSQQPLPHIAQANLRANLNLLASNICIVTQYTIDLKDYADIATQNHSSYAAAHGYTYQFFEGRISEDEFLAPGNKIPARRLGLYWQKVTATLQTGPINVLGFFG
jgi:hypothetical protein